EMHLLTIYDAVKKFKPRVVVMDPVTNLVTVGTEIEVRSMLTRLIDFFKTEQVTAVFPSLTRVIAANPRSPYLHLWTYGCYFAILSPEGNVTEGCTY
ncbi:MAG: KaiC 1, partial [Verrucomicrobiales bacterium]|nr:KaiC 1 [Verrucomicrobiales bacterium]